MEPLHEHPQSPRIGDSRRCCGKCKTSNLKLPVRINGIYVKLPKNVFVFSKAFRSFVKLNDCQKNTVVNSSNENEKGLTTLKDFDRKQNAAVEDAGGENLGKQDEDINDGEKENSKSLKCKHSSSIENADDSEDFSSTDNLESYDDENICESLDDNESSDTNEESDSDKESNESNDDEDSYSESDSSETNGEEDSDSDWTHNLYLSTFC